jgi:hypothetical protein
LFVLSQRRYYRAFTFAHTPDIGLPTFSTMSLTASRLTPEDTQAVVAHLASLPWSIASEH